MTGKMLKAALARAELVRPFYDAAKKAAGREWLTYEEIVKVRNEVRAHVDGSLSEARLRHLRWVDEIYDTW